MWNFLRFIPFLGRFLSGISAWLLRRRWGYWLMFYLAGAVGAMLAKLLSFIGIAFIVNEFGMSSLIGYVSGPLLGLPDPFPQLLAMTNIDKAATLIISATVVNSLQKVRIGRKSDTAGWLRGVA